jgi:hypothetical protein
LSLPARTASRWLISGELRWLLGDGVTTMSFRTAWRPRSFDRRGESRPNEGEGGGWRCSGGAGLRVMDIALDWLRIRTIQGREEVRRVKVEGIGERGRAQTHRRRHNRPETLAVLRTIGEEFIGLGWVFARKEKRRRGRNSWGIYRRPLSCGKG